VNKPRVIFIFLSVYVIAAFGWWTYAHYLSSNEIYAKQKDILELISYKATIEVNGAYNQELFNDTNDVLKFFGANYPKHEIVFDTKNDPLQNFLIRPKLGSYQEIERRYERKNFMYLLEGIVMMILLFWGIIWIYLKLQRSIEFKRNQSNFLLSVSHELKTPITSLKLNLETLLKRDLDRGNQKSMLENSLSDIDRLKELVENILLSAQLEGKKYSLYIDEMDLSKCLDDAVNKFAERDHSEKSRFKKNIAPEIYAQADIDAIKMVINNLLDNALKYSAPDKIVEVSLSQDEEQIVLRVADQGPGISETEIKGIFEKFYRIEDENVRKTKGTGLGLYIVKNLLILHNASIEVLKNHPSGTIFEVTLQKNEQ